MSNDLVGNRCGLETDEYGCVFFYILSPIYFYINTQPNYEETSLVDISEKYNTDTSKHYSVCLNIPASYQLALTNGVQYKRSHLCLIIGLLKNKASQGFIPTYMCWDDVGMFGEETGFITVIYCMIMLCYTHERLETLVYLVWAFSWSLDRPHAVHRLLQCWTGWWRSLWPLAAYWWPYSRSESGRKNAKIENLDNNLCMKPHG